MSVYQRVNPHVLQLKTSSNSGARLESSQHVLQLPALLEKTARRWGTQLTSISIYIYPSIYIYIYIFIYLFNIHTCTYIWKVYHNIICKYISIIHIYYTIIHIYYTYIYYTYIYYTYILYISIIHIYYIYINV